MTLFLNPNRHESSNRLTMHTADIQPETKRPTSMVKPAFAIASLLFCIFAGPTLAQEVRCDPEKVMTADACAKCHINETRTWKKTPHHQTYELLGRTPEAKEICSKLGLRSVKRSDVCIKCHFTLKTTNGKLKAVSGISCESCHGASKDWINVHNATTVAESHPDYESSVSRQMEQATGLGMRNTRSLYSIASSCLNCHTVPDEHLVNVGGHLAGSEDFELVSWSQGSIRHNFVRNNGQANTTSNPARLRKMFVIGLIADLEYSTRATAKATQRSRFGMQVAQRAAAKASQLFEIQQQINDPNLGQVLRTFLNAELKTNNEQALITIANQIRNSGTRFEREVNPDALEAIDDLLPGSDQYR